MYKFRTTIALIVLAAGCALTSCSTVRPESFKDTTPKLVIEDYFAGNTRAWGIVVKRSGEISRQFTVDLNGTLDGKVLTLDEHFLYSDGKKQQRIWRITKLDEHTYEGRADDVVGIARGKQYGQALNWRYVLRLEVDGEIWNVSFDDWMYLQSDNVLVNRAVMSKFGFDVAEVILFFRK